MRFSSDPAEKNQIRACESGAIHLQDRVIEQHVILSADRIMTDWNPSPIASLSIDDFAPALELKPDVILFGTGDQQQFPDLRVMTEIMRSGIAIEVMATPAACRTFNVLINERRAAVAALLVD